mmetsp:Transcript_20276/g.32441  ORF Transcript_20276/g.32441 Transcript_20276/m.32441 type:complete len:218 (+) Transcript_20276:612-1265(+)
MAAVIVVVVSTAFKLIPVVLAVVLGMLSHVLSGSKAIAIRGLIVVDLSGKHRWRRRWFTWTRRRRVSGGGGGIVSWWWSRRRRTSSATTTFADIIRLCLYSWYDLRRCCPRWWWHCRTVGRLRIDGHVMMYRCRRYLCRDSFIEPCGILFFLFAQLFILFNLACAQLCCFLRMFGQFREHINFFRVNRRIDFQCFIDGLIVFAEALKYIEPDEIHVC